MNYITQLTFLRFIAALLIIVCHFGSTTAPFDTGFINAFVREGSIAVSFFFFLSGTVLFLTYGTKSRIHPRQFYLKRFARIYPVYVIAFLITLLLGMFVLNAYPKGLAIILQLFSLHAWYPGSCLSINFPGWSISVEVFFYLLFPVIMYLLRKLSFKQQVILICSVWLLSLAQHYYFIYHLHLPPGPESDQFMLYFPLWPLNTFLFGILAGSIIQRMQQTEKKHFNAARLSYVVGSVLFVLLLVTNNPFRPLVHNGGMSPLFLLIIVGLAMDRSLITKALSHNYCILLGNASYSMYILQWPVYIMFGQLFGTDTLSGASFYTYLISLITISCITYFFFEKGMRSFILRKWGRSDTA